MAKTSGMNRQQRMIYSRLMATPRGMTYYELIDAFYRPTNPAAHIEPLLLPHKVKQLEALGYIRKAEEKRTTRSGRGATVWMATVNMPEDEGDGEEGEG